MFPSLKSTASFTFSHITSTVPKRFTVIQKRQTVHQTDSPDYHKSTAVLLHFIFLFGVCSEVLAPDSTLFLSALTGRTPRKHTQMAILTHSNFLLWLLLSYALTSYRSIPHPLSGYDASFLSKRHIQKHLNNEHHAVRILNLALKPTRLHEFPYSQLCHNTSNYSLILISHMKISNVLFILTSYRPTSLPI
jgi:hypothetical protein